MKKSLLKNNIKEISKTRRRFISILIMAFLGVGFYAGLNATSPDMLESLDSYADNSNMYDIQVISTLGLTDDDINAIKQIDGIDKAYGIQTKEAISKTEGKEKVCKIIEYNENINKPNVSEGRMPETSNECLLDSRYTIEEDVNSLIGKKIILENDDTNEDGSKVLTQTEFTIVGIAETPIYISNERGNTSIGNGSISYYIYTKDDVINLDYYTEICATVKNAKQYVTNSDEYLNTVNPVKEKVEEIKAEREQARYQGLIDKANKKLDDAQAEYDSKKAEVDSQLQDAETQINNAKTELNNSEIKLQNSEKEIQKQEANANSQFKNAETQIKNAEAQLSEKQNELTKSKNTLTEKKAEAEAGISRIEENIAQTQVNLEALQKQKQDSISAGITDTTQIDALIYQATVAIENLNAKKAEIQAGITSAENQIADGEKQLNSARSELQANKNKLNANKSYSQKQLASAKAKIASGKEQLEKGKTELAEKESEFETSKAEAEEKLNNAQKEINDARDKVGKIEKATWYVQERTDNLGYSNIFDAIKTMSNISKLFPIIFYLVAVLISLTSMTRMIEEERIEIGTLKSLGYTDLQIIIKYILYAFLACIIGGILGMSLGFDLLPSIVWSLYSTMYTIPDFHFNYQLGIGLAGTFIAFACIGGATILVAHSELKETPAALMRPKAPKNGKKIFLEKITFIWRRLNFSKKVTMRNIFRYKKRAIMTIVGIAGCTGLMLTGFGIRDSIIDIPNSQFKGIFQYDSSITLSNADNINSIEKYMNESDKVESYSKICANTGKLKASSRNYDATIFVPNSVEEFEKVCNLKDYKTGEKITLNNEGIIITDKVAEFINAKVGDEVTLIDGDNIEYHLKVSGIAQNYVSNYVYMTKDFYNANVKTFNVNMILLKAIPSTTDDELNKISEELLNIDGVASVSIISSLMSSITDMLGTLNYIVLILVIASALLDFVVLYNLANINIGERQREIATLKVLGFYDKEVDNYINKENLIFTIVGILLGLVFGYFLTDGVVASVEIDKLKFIRQVAPISYLYSAVITAIFSVIVNKVIHFVLKKIDMIESLKSVE